MRDSYVGETINIEKHIKNSTNTWLVILLALSELKYISMYIKNRIKPALDNVDANAKINTDRRVLLDSFFISKSTSIAQNIIEA
jgi:hypothetical protein|tara:strand:+ start:1868 stop:2119 length:252 start_codon:yes stop_codon:yes gene_type:complete